MPLDSDQSIQSYNVYLSRKHFSFVVVPIHRVSFSCFIWSSSFWQNISISSSATFDYVSFVISSSVTWNCYFYGSVYSNSLLDLLIVVSYSSLVLLTLVDNLTAAPVSFSRLLILLSCNVTLSMCSFVLLLVLWSFFVLWLSLLGLENSGSVFLVHVFLPFTVIYGVSDLFVRLFYSGLFVFFF